MKQLKINKLNLGCGTDIRKGFINLDYFDHKGVDVVYDLNQYPYPFEDNQFDEILLLDILEHLDRPAECIRELWRISKPGCKIKITAPHYTSTNAWGDMTHVKPFSQNSMMPFDIKQCKGQSLEYHQKEKFEVKVELLIPKIYRYSGIGFFIDNLPRLYERFFAYVLPIQGITFHLRTIKNG
ncbi:MAG: methyltransferase domain-containing protein [archaeon]